MGGVDLKDQLLQSYLVERKKVTKWQVKMFRRLLNVAILNLCRANSGQFKMDNFEVRVDLVHALLIEHGSQIERKVQGCHSTDKNVPALLERHFPEKQRKRPGQQIGVWCATNTTKGRRQCFGVLIVRLNFAFSAVSRHFTPS
jgi:hypothetical protein